MAKLQQYLSDRLKLAKDQSVWLSYRGRRLRVVHPGDDVDRFLGAGTVEAFCKSKFGITLVRGLHRHERRLRAGCRYMNDDQVMGIVVEAHDEGGEK